MKNLRYKDSELREWVYAAASTIHGTGLFAAKPIKRGQYIGTYWGPTAKRNGMYVLWVYEDADDPDSAVGRSGRNLLRYLNHKKKCNGEFDGYDFFATKNIATGQEITFDYGDEFIVE